MPNITEAELKKQIAHEAFSPLYVLYGEEKYLLSRAVKKLIQKAAGQNFPEFNRNEFTSSASIDRIADAANALPLMAERKCVAVSDFNPEEKSASEIQKLQELLADLSDSTVLIFYFPTMELGGKTTAKWRNFLKKATEVGSVIEFKGRETSELTRLMMREAEKRGCSLAKTEAKRLIDYCGGDLNVLMNEMEKLCAFSSGEITREIIEKLVTKNTETTAFLLADAVVGGNYEKAYLLLRQLFDAGEEPIAVLGALSMVYVDMMRVKAALQSGLSSSAPMKYGEYRGDYRLRKAERSAKLLSMEGLRACLAVLLETDVALKSSRADSRLLMDKLIGKLLLCSREGLS